MSTSTIVADVRRTITLPEPRLGTCLFCGERTSYQSSPTRGLWVHTLTGNPLSQTPSLHDANTHTRPDPRPDEARCTEVEWREMLGT